MPDPAPEAFRDQWRALRDLTAGMREAADAEDWEAARRLDHERRAILSRMPAEPPEMDPVDAEALRAEVDELVALDRAVMEQAAAARATAAEQLGTLQQGLKAQRAYEENE